MLKSFLCFCCGPLLDHKSSKFTFYPTLLLSLASMILVHCGNSVMIAKYELSSILIFLNSLLYFTIMTMSNSATHLCCHLYDILLSCLTHLSHCFLPVNLQVNVRINTFLVRLLDIKNRFKNLWLTNSIMFKNERF